MTETAITETGMIETAMTEAKAKTMSRKFRNFQSIESLNLVSVTAEAKVLDHRAFHLVNSLSPFTQMFTESLIAMNP
jgi:hypothetical protein